MASGDKLVDVPRGESVTASEVEQFKLVRHSEKAFLSALRPMVDDLLLKVGPKNALYQSMARFLRARG